MNGFDALRKRIIKIADEVLAIDGAYPTWDYADLMQLIDAVEAECKTVKCKDCKYSDEFERDMWLCRRLKKSIITSSESTCNKGKRK